MQKVRSTFTKLSGHLQSIVQCYQWQTSTRIQSSESTVKLVDEIKNALLASHTECLSKDDDAFNSAFEVNLGKERKKRVCNSRIY